jgi:hypothetical protein
MQDYGWKGAIYKLISLICSNIQGNVEQPSTEQQEIETGTNKTNLEKEIEALKISAAPRNRRGHPNLPKFIVSSNK